MEKVNWPDDFRATVEGAIISAAERPYNSPDGKPHKNFWLGVGGHPLLNFHFVISEKGIAALKRVGIDDLEKHFVGKLITVRGVMSTVEYNLSSGPKMYVLGIDGLDQFIEVKSIKKK